MPDGPPPIDLSGLANAIWASLLDHLDQLGATIWDHLSRWLYSMLRELVLTIWHATLLPIPHETTDQFAPVMAMMPEWRAVAGAGFVLSLALIGLRTILRAVPFGHTAAVDYLTGRFLLWAFIAANLQWLIAHAIDLEQVLAQVAARADLDTVLPRDAAPNPVAFVVLVIFGLRLWLKVASNVVHVAVAIVWAPVAAVLALIPSTAHIGSLWAHEFFGRLAGAVLATVASGIGLALALSNTGGSVFAIVGTAGAFIAAADLVDWLAKTPGTSVGSVTGQMLRTAALLPGLVWPSGAGAAMAAGAGAAPAMSAGALPAPQATTRYGLD